MIAVIIGDVPHRFFKGAIVNSVTLRPDVRLKTKFYLILVIVGVLALLGTGLFIGFIAADEEASNPVGWAVLLSTLINALWIVPLVLLIGPYFRSLQYEIEDDEVLVRVGVITKSVKHVPYRTVTNLTVVRGPFDRLFGLGTLNIQTAGMSGQQGAEESLIGLTNYQEVYDRVAAMLRRYRGAMTPDQSGVGSEPPRVDGQLLAEILDEIKAIRRDMSPPH